MDTRRTSIIICSLIMTGIDKEDAMDKILTLIFGELTAASIWEACGQQVNDTGEIDLLMVIQYFTERKWNSKFWKLIGR